MIILSEVEKREWLVLAQSGDLSARNRLIEAHLNVVIHFARRFARPGAFIEVDDLIQQGRLGLMRAIEKFDVNRTSRGAPVSFVTYATYWIKHAMRRSIQKHGRTVAIPIELQRRLSAKKSVERAAEVVSIDHAFETEMIDSAADPQRALAESPEWQLSQRERRQDLYRWLALLPSRERSIIEQLYGFTSGAAPSTALEVGARLGISEQRVGQIKMRAITSLREAAMSKMALGPI